MNKKTLVILAGVAMLIAVFAFTFAPAPRVAYAQNPTPAPQPPVAVLKVVGVPANAALPGAITATLSYITDTAVGAAKTSVALGTSGLSNVPINEPVRLAVSAADPKNSGKPTWTLTTPPGSKAAIKDPAAMATEFTPDVVGAYMVGVTLKNDAGLTSAAQFAFFNAGTYIGMTAGNCQQCHPSKVADWSKTGHASIFQDNINNARTPTVDSHYSEGCIRCHTVGYFLPAANNGGFADAQAKTGWKVPTLAQINAAGKKTGPDNFTTAPAEIQNMGNIQCENCHGPASEHVKTGANVMAVSFENDTCNQCHAGGGTHIKGLDIANSKHFLGATFEEITGPGEQACQRCHSGAGFASFIANPKNPAAWVSNEPSYIGCPACHDPHSDANYAQLRVVGKPVEIPFQLTKDVGLSAICFTCHNSRADPANAVKSSFPHYSSIAEMLSDTAGVTYGQTVPNSPHGTLVGAAPVPNPTTPGTFLFSKSDDKKGNVPGPCVTCHMWPGIQDTKDPNIFKVGEHSFNTVSPDGTFDYGAACKSCHGDVKDFNLKAKADYDGNGKVEGVQDEIKGLLGVLWKGLEAKGVKKVDTGYPYATLPKDASGNTDDKIDNAYFNFRTVYGVMWGVGADGKPTSGQEGKAQAIHNFKRSCALLQLSIEDLTGSLPTGATDCTK